MTAGKIMIRAVVLAPPDVVFEALTDADALRTWFAEEADCRLAGGRFSFWGRYTPFGDEPRQRLLATDSRTLLRFAWELAGVDTIVEIRIGDTGTGDAEVTVTQQPVPRSPDGGRVGIGEFWCLALGNLSNFAEGRPPVLRHDYLAPGDGDLTAQVDVDAPPEEVFAALESRTGGGCDFGWGHGPVTIEAIDPPRYLAYRWRADTVMRWTVEPRDLGSRVTVRHAGGGTGAGREHQQITWENMLVGLQRMVELGRSWRPIELRASQGVLTESADDAGGQPEAGLVDVVATFPTDS